MLDQNSLEKWNQYAIDRLRRYEEEQLDQTINIRDVLRQGTSGQYTWELLQNAEDAHASNVSIDLRKEYLLFQHNGQLKFTLKDAIAISKVGFSGKIDQPSIGQFGVGFKSVFKYAERVEIYAGNLRFALENYTKIINPIPPIPEVGENKEITCFKVIFRKDLQDSAVKDSLEILNNFNHEALLFLQHLKQITISSDGLKGQIQKKDIGNSQVQITTVKNEVTDTSYWYQRTQSVTTELKDGNSDTKSTRETYLGYAIKLAEAGDKYKFCQADKGKIFTYFPLNEQISNLKFHIHAPFVINLNRSMLDTNEKNMNENNKLIKSISILLSSDILQLHAAKAIDESLLTVLPVSSDDLPTYLGPINQDILQIFKSNNMVQVADGIYANPGEVFQAVPEIIEFIGNHGLVLFNEVTNSKLQRVEPGKSVQGKYLLPQSSEARIRSFLRHIGVAVIDNTKISNFFDELSFIFSGANRNINLAQIQNSLNLWLESKSDLATGNIYAMLGKLEIPRIRLMNLPIFRTSAGEKNNYRKIDNVYLASRSDQNEIDVIKTSIYFKENVELDNLQELQNFFINLGITEKDEWTVLEHSVAEVRHPENTEKEKLRMNYFLNFYNIDRSRFLNIVHGKVALIGEKFNSEKKFWEHPSKIYRSTLDFNVNKLNSLAKESEQELVLWSGYSLTPEFEDMVQDLGINSNLRIKVYPSTVSFLQTIIDSKDLSLIKILWRFIQTLDYSAFFERSGKVAIETDLLKQLKEIPWIPMSDGSFVTPYECDPANLADEFQDFSGIFFSVSGFGQKTLEAALRSDTANSLAKEAGFDSAEQHLLMVELSKQYPVEELKRMLRTKQMNEYSQIPNLEREVDSSKQSERKNLQIEHVAEVVNTRSTYEPAQEERKEHLKKIYGNLSGEISCQMCHLKQMPFKTPISSDGIHWDYFEAVALFTKHNKESNVNALALCPNCSAKIKNFRKNYSKGLSDKEVKNEIIRLKNELVHINLNNPEIYFEFEILNTSYEMKFNKKHLLSLYGLLEVAQEQ